MQMLIIYYMVCNAKETIQEQNNYAQLMQILINYYLECNAKKTVQEQNNKNKFFETLDL